MVSISLLWDKRLFNIDMLRLCDNVDVNHTIQIKACFERQSFGFIVIVISRCIKLVYHVGCKILFALWLPFRGRIILTANIIA